MNIRQLTSFLKVLELGSISAAAQSLNTSQSALSQQIILLEHSVGVSLFQRNSRGVRPTLEASRLEAYAREILGTIERAKTDIGSKQNDPKGEVRLGLPSAVCPVIGHEIIDRISTQWPRISLFIVEGMSGTLSEMLSSGRIDIAVLYNARDTEGFEAEYLLTEPLALVGRLSLFGIPDQPIQAQKLSGLPLVSTRSPNGLRLLIERWAEHSDIDLAVEIEVDSASILLSLLESRELLTICSRTGMTKAIEEGRVQAVGIEDRPVERNVFLCRTKKTMPSFAARSVSKELGALCRELVEGGKWQGRLRS